MTNILEKEYSIKSNKYDVEGKILDYGMSVKLVFSYDGKQIVMGVAYPFDGDMSKMCISMMESYIEQLHVQSSERRLSLHYWFINSVTCADNETYLCAHGIVTGHNRLQDSTFVHTSQVMSITIDYALEEALISTQNSTYHCPLKYCAFKEQDKVPDLIPNYEEIKKRYENITEDPKTDDNKVLLVLSNFDEYYFHSLYCKSDSDPVPKNYCARAHIGNFQDSFLIQSSDYKIDLRYFPHFQCIEFYSSDTDNMPLFAENIGDIPLFIKTSFGTICLPPGVRKEICKSNAESKSPSLSNGDLYPAGIIE